MRRRTRKLIGAAVLALFIPIYLVTAMIVAATRLPGTTELIQTLYYAVAGLAWVIPAGLLITWMQRPDRRAE